MPLSGPQFLKPLLSEPRNNPTVGFDCETHGKRNDFVLGVISTPETDMRFTNAGEMLDSLVDYKIWNHSVYATNLAFDAFVLFQAHSGARKIPNGWEAFDNGAKMIYVRKLLRAENSTTRNAKRYQVLMDSLNLFPGGVEKMGKILGIVSRQYEKEGNLELARFYNERKLEAPSIMGKKSYQALSLEERESLFTYCAADARVTRKFMQWFNGDIVKLGAQPRYTAASTAMDLFRRKYMREGGIIIPQPSWQCMVQSRFAYYGGRVEDFSKGLVTPAIDNDVTAMYPSAMAEIEFPYPSPERFTKWEDPPMECLQKEGFANVSIRVPDMEYPPLPWRDSTKLLFPTGYLQGTWTHLELRHAIKVGCIIDKINWAYYTDKTFNPFRAYVNDLITKRLYYLCPGCDRSRLTGIPCHVSGEKCENEMATAEVVKLFLNGLYGKFAQNFLTDEEAKELGINAKSGGGTFKTIEEANDSEIEFTANNHPEYLAEGIVISAAIPKLKAFMNPILAAYVTARARVKLHEFILSAQRENATVFYVDTDSLYTDKQLSFSTKSKSLGQLQEGKQYRSMVILGPKAKWPEGSEAPTAKGIPRRSFVFDGDTQRTVEPRKDLFLGLKEENTSVKFTRFAKVREAFARNLSPNEMISVTKKMNPFAEPKRRILGKPTLKSLWEREYRTKAWEVNEEGELIA